MTYDKEDIEAINDLFFLTTNMPANFGEKRILFLLRHGANVHTPSGLLCLTYACTKGYIQIIKYIFENNTAAYIKNISVNSCLLSKACENTNQQTLVSLTSYILENGSDINERTIDNKHVLCVAFESQREMVLINYLLTFKLILLEKDIFTCYEIAIRHKSLSKLAAIV